MKPSFDYYEVLGLDKNAEQKDIRRAFMKKARALHPDVNKEPDAEERFKEVNEAYSVLSDETKRANYDRYGDPEGPVGFGGAGAGGFDFFDGGLGDIFSTFFGGGAGRSVSSEGDDMAVGLTVTLEEAAAGCSKNVAFDRLAPCDDCNGTGLGEDGHVSTCSRCHGSGYVIGVQRGMFGNMQVQMECPDCHGSGSTIDKPCETCNGEGRAPKHEKVKVNIPAGIHSGQQLRIDGFGEAGIRGAHTGDLYVRVRIAPSERFERQGDDLYCPETINSFEAICGCEFDIPGILENETIHVVVPAGTQNGDRIEVTGKGMPRLRSESRGRFIVVVSVETPVNLTDKELKQLRKLATAHASQHGVSQQDLEDDDK